MSQLVSVEELAKGGIVALAAKSRELNEQLSDLDYKFKIFQEHSLELKIPNNIFYLRSVDHYKEQSKVYNKIAAIEKYIQNNLKNVNKTRELVHWKTKGEVEITETKEFANKRKRRIEETEEQKEKRENKEDMKEEKKSKKRKVVSDNFSKLPRDILDIIFAFEPDFLRLRALSNKMNVYVKKRYYNSALNIKTDNPVIVERILQNFKPRSVILPKHTPELEKLVIEDNTVLKVEYLALSVNFDYFDYIKKMMVVITPNTINETMYLMSNTTKEEGFLKYAKTRSGLDMLYKPSAGTSRTFFNYLNWYKVQKDYFCDEEMNKKCLQNLSAERDLEKLEFLSKLLDISDYLKSNTWVYVELTKRNLYYNEIWEKDFGIDFNDMKNNQEFLDEVLQLLVDQTVSTYSVLDHYNFDYSLFSKCELLPVGIIQNYLTYNKPHLIRRVGVDNIINHKNFKRAIYIELENLTDNFDSMKNLVSELELRKTENKFVHNSLIYNALKDKNKFVMQVFTQVGINVSSFTRNALTMKSFFEKIHGLKMNVMEAAEFAQSYGFPINEAVRKYLQTKMETIK